MADTAHAMAILFADLGESTHLYESLGDEKARSITSKCLARMIEVVGRHSGRLIKTIGDEVMATFPTADQAADAATDILAAVSAFSGSDSVRLGAHVGFHYGSVIHEEGDVFGDVVNVAARIVSLAKNGEILTTRQAVDALSPGRRACARQIDRRSVRGREEVLEVFQFMAETEDVTSMFGVAFSEDRRAGRLLVSFGSQSFVVTPEHSSLSIGRHRENDLMIDDTRVSRRHATIRLRHAKFVLRDESTNGTLVVIEDGRPIALHREDLTLHGSGRFGVTPEVGSDTELPISFRVEP